MRRFMHSSHVRGAGGGEPPAGGSTYNEQRPGAAVYSGVTSNEPDRRPGAGGRPDRYRGGHVLRRPAALPAARRERATALYAAWGRHAGGPARGRRHRRRLRADRRGGRRAGLARYSTARRRGRDASESHGGWLIWNATATGT